MNGFEKISNRLTLISDDTQMVSDLSAQLPKRGFEVGVALPNDIVSSKGECYMSDYVLLEESVPIDVVRQVFPQSFKIVVSNSNDGDHAAKMLEEGADQYLSKPLNPRHVEAVLRSLGRSLNRNTPVELGNFVFDPRSRTIRKKNGQIIEPNRREFDILGYLVRKGDRRISTSEELLEFMKKKGMKASDPEVRVYMSLIRDLIDVEEMETHIQNYRGVGYKFYFHPELKKDSPLSGNDN